LYNPEEGKIRVGFFLLSLFYFFNISANERMFVQPRPENVE